MSEISTKVPSKQTLEICANCGTLIVKGSRCSNCQLTFDENLHKYDRWVKTP